MQHENRVERNPWKVATLSILAVAGAVLVSGIVIAAVSRNSAQDSAQEATPTQAEAAASKPQSAPAAPASASCEHHLQGTQRDIGHIAKDGLVGGAVGAGLGAAGGAIVSGGKGAGKGAGVGALVGAAAGSAYGYDQESKKAEQARAAYQRCLAEKG